jgi:predicted nucleotidyltransferase
MPPTEKAFTDMSGLPASRPNLRELVHSHRDELGAVLGSLGASRIRLFGSVARGDWNEQSDVDLLVALDAGVGLFALSRMRGAAERTLGVDVDVVPEDSLKPDVRESVLADAVTL